MEIKLYCDLYVSSRWQQNKKKLFRKLKRRKIIPDCYVITLAQGQQNQLEFFSCLLLHQHVFDHSKLFIIGIADGYADALYYLSEFTEKVYRETKDADLKNYIVKRQEEFEKTGR